MPRTGPAGLVNDVTWRLFLPKGSQILVFLLEPDNGRDYGEVPAHGQCGAALTTAAIPSAYFECRVVRRWAMPRTAPSFRGGRGRSGSSSRKMRALNRFTRGAGYPRTSPTTHSRGPACFLYAASSSTARARVSSGTPCWRRDSTRRAMGASSSLARSSRRPWPM